MRKTILKAFILFTLLWHLINSQGCLNLYVNNTASTTVASPSGSLTNPFTNLISVFAAIQQNCTNTTAVVYIASTNTPYTFTNNSSQGIVIDYPILNLSLIGYPSNQAEGFDCSLLPTIQLNDGDFVLNYTSARVISFSGINFVNDANSSSNSSSTQVSLKFELEGSIFLQNLCLSVVGSQTPFLQASSNSSISYSNLFLNGVYSLEEPLLNMSAPKIIMNNIIASNLTLTSCNSSIIEVIRCDAFSLENAMIQNLKSKCPFLDLQSVADIQLQNVLAENVSLTQETAFILTSYQTNLISYGIVADSVNFSNFGDAAGAIQVTGLINNVTLSFSFSNSQLNMLYFQQSAILIDFQISSNLMISNCLFYNIFGGISGSAVTTNGYLDCVNCTFINNFANGNGGAIYTFGDSNITNSTFTNNSAFNHRDGGALYANGNATIVNSNFTSNFAEKNGGAVFAGAAANIINCTLTNNSAYANGSAIYAGGDTSITNSTFTSNFGIFDPNSSTIATSASGTSINSDGDGGAIYVGGDANVTDSVFTNNLASLNGGAICVLGGSANIANSIFTNNTANSSNGGGAIFANGDASVTDCIFTNNNADNCNGGGALFTNEDANIATCAFINNSAGYSGGAVYTSGDANIANSSFITNFASSFYGGAICTIGDANIANSWFINNSAGYDGGAVYSNGDANIVNGTFTNNSAENNGGVICLGGDINITSCNFTNNSAAVGGGAIYAGANVIIVSSDFVNNVASYGNGGGAIFAQLDTSIFACTFTSNIANLGGAIAVVYGNVGVVNCSFMSNSANSNEGGGGGAIYSETFLSIANSNFTNNHANVAYGGGVSTTSEVNITNCNFLNNTANAGGGVSLAVGDGGESFIMNSNFVNNIAIGYFGGAIFASSGTTIVQSTFANNLLLGASTGSENTYGGALYSTVQSIVTDCIFINNTANNGGAAYIPAESLVINSTFSSNTATNGGAAYITVDLSMVDCLSTSITDTESSIGCVYSFSNSTFINNTASDGQGSALLFELPQSTDQCTPLDSNYLSILSNNSSNYFLNNTSPLPFILNGITYNSCNGLSSSVSPQPILQFNMSSSDEGVLVSECDLLNLSWSSSSPMSPISWNISVVANSQDCWLNVYSDNSTDKSIEITYLQNLTISSAECDPSWATCTIDNPLSGLTFDENLTSIQYSFTYQSSVFTVNSPTFNLVLRNCDIGEIITLVNGYPSCVQCPPGTYSLTHNATSCLPCPGDASLCINGSIIYLKENMWRSSIYSDNILQCRVDGVCLGGSSPSNCSEGYEGPLCQACNNSMGYARSSADSCAQCKGTTLEVLIIALITSSLVVGYFIFYSSYNLATTKKILSDQHAEDNINTQEGSIYLRLFSAYCQIITILNTSIQNLTSDLETTIGLVGSPQNSILYSTICLFIKLDLDQDYNLYLLDIVISSSFPLFVIILVAIGYIVSWKFRVNRSRLCILINMALCIMSLCQPAAVQKLLSFLQCSPLPNDPDQNSYIYTQMNYQCNTAASNFFFYTYIMPSLFVWLVLLPCAPLLVLYRNRNNLEDHRLRISFGIWLRGFKPEAYYWGTIDMFMKLSLIGVSTLLYMDTKTNALTLCGVLYIYYILFKKVQPYFLTKPNEIELYTVFGYILTIFLWFYIQGNSSEILTICGIVLMITINILIIYTLVVNFWRTIRPGVTTSIRKVSIFIKPKSPQLTGEQTKSDEARSRSSQRDPNSILEKFNLDLEMRTDPSN